MDLPSTPLLIAASAESSPHFGPDTLTVFLIVRLEPQDHSLKHIRTPATARGDRVSRPPYPIGSLFFTSPYSVSDHSRVATMPDGVGGHRRFVHSRQARCDRASRASPPPGGSRWEVPRPVGALVVTHRSWQDARHSIAPGSAPSGPSCRLWERRAEDDTAPLPGSHLVDAYTT